MSFTDFRKNFSSFFLTVLIFAAVFAAAINLSAQALYVREKNVRGETGRSDNKIKPSEDSSVFADFENWIEQNESRNFRNLDKHNALGERLAIQRREILKKLIQQNPQAALEKAISPKISENLPSFISQHLEKRISARGDFLVYSMEKSSRADEPTIEADEFRQVIIGDARYKAFVYGRRETMTTKLDIPLQGIAIDDVMVVDESPVRPINSADYASRAIDGASFGIETNAAEVGGKVVYFSNRTELDNFVDEEIKWESTIGPTRSKNNAAQSSSSPEQTASAWTTGPKSVLFIRADFSDKPGEPLDRKNNSPLTVAKVQSLFANEVNPFFVSNSYGKTSLQVTVTQEVVRLPQTLAFYTQGNNFNEMYKDARVAARAKGYETDNFNFDIVGFSFTDEFSWLGNSIVGSKGNLLNGAFYGYETAHELGHNYGLQHAHFWLSTDGTSIGAGEDDEVRDCYDLMSYCPQQGINTHFNARYKNLLDWLPDADAPLITQNGTYRIYAQDASQSGTRALKIRKNDAINYWVEFRQLIPGNAMNGALIRREDSRQEYRYTQLLDMNPTTFFTTGDAPLAIGQTFVDSASGIKITALGKGGTDPESLNVYVEINKTVNCAYTISPTSILLSATGHDTSTFIDVTAQSSDCNWTASTADSWISLNASGGSGSGKISFSVQPNIGSARSGTITIAGLKFTVNQSAGGCGYSVYPSDTISIPATGGPLNFEQRFETECSALSGKSTNQPSWINVNTNPITIAPNNGGAARSGTVTLTGTDAKSNVPVELSITVNQAGTNGCAFAVSPPTTNLIENGGAAGNVSVTVTSGSGCGWTAASNVSWITITSGTSGSSSGTVNFTVAANSSVARTGSITVAGQTLTFSQAAGKTRKRIRILF